MRLLDLNPRWVGAGGEGITDKDGNPAPQRIGVGITFNCPCGCKSRCAVLFSNPLDNGAPIDDRPNVWHRVGNNFDTLTLTPSIQRADPGGCHWHGFVENGAIRNA